MIVVVMAMEVYSIYIYIYIYKGGRVDLGMVLLMPLGANVECVIRIAMK